MGPDALWVCVGTGEVGIDTSSLCIDHCAKDDGRTRLTYIMGSTPGNRRIAACRSAIVNFKLTLKQPRLY